MIALLESLRARRRPTVAAPVPGIAAPAIHLDLVYLGLMLGFGLLLRMFLLRYHTVLEGDAFAYASVALKLVEGDLVSGLRQTIQGQLFPAATAAFYLMTHDIELAPRLVSMVFGTLTILPVYALGTRLFDRRIGLTAGLLVMVQPALTEHSMLGLTEVMYTFFVACVAAVGWRFLTDGSWRVSLLLGGLVGLLALVRPEGVGYGACLAVLLALSTATTRAPIHRQALKIALLCLAAASVLVPVYAFIWHLTGENAALSKGGEVFKADYFAGLRDLRSELQLESQLGEDGLSELDRVTRQQSALSYLLANPTGTLVRMAANLTAAERWLPWLISGRYGPLILVVSAIALSLGALSSVWQTWMWRRQVYVLLFCLYPAFAYSPIVIDNRFLLGATPFLALLIALGLREIDRWWHGIYPLAQARQRPGAVVGSLLDRVQPALPLTAILVVACLVGVIRGQAAWNTQPWVERQLPWKEMALWMRTSLPTSPAETTILTDCDQLAFYYYADGRRQAGIPYTDYSRLVERARANGVQYIVAVDGATLSQAIPTLFYNNELGADLERVHSIDDGRGLPKVVLYRVRGSGDTP